MPLPMRNTTFPKITKARLVRFVRSLNLKAANQGNRFLWIERERDGWSIGRGASGTQFHDQIAAGLTARECYAVMLGMINAQ